MGRRLLVGFAVVPALFCAAAATAGTSKPAQSWAAPQIKLVAAAGLFDASTVASFRPDDVLTAQALEDLSFELKQRLAELEPPTEPLIPTDPTTTTSTTETTTVGTTTTAPPVTTTPIVTIPDAPKQVANPTKPVTMTQLDQRLVQTLGLGKAATEFTHGAKYAGLKAPARFGSEVPKSNRITLANLQPADVIFFGDNGPKSQPSQVGHMGIYVGNGWFIHSSEYGVALAQLTGWYAKEFAWGRRPLAEAGLE